MAVRTLNASGMNNENSPLSLPAPAPVSIEDRVRLIRIQTFFAKASGNAVSLLAAGVFFALLLQDAGVPGGRLLFWVALLVISTLTVLAFERKVRIAGLSQSNAERYFRWRTVLGCVSSSLFGATCFLLPEQASTTSYTFIFIMSSSVVVTGYLAYATAFFYCLMVYSVTLLPFTLFCFYRYAATSETFFVLMGVSAILWQVIIAGKALQVSRSVHGEIEARERLRDEMAERQQTEQALRASEAESQRLAVLLRMMCDNVPDMIWAKDRENRYLFANMALCEKLLNASDTQEPIGKTFDDFVQRERRAHPDDAQWYTFGQFSQDVDQHTLGRDEPTHFEESGNVCGRFVYFDVHQAPFVNARGEVIGTVGSARDITERKAAEVYVQHLAHHDVLTDLPNRGLLNDRMGQALAHTRRDRLKLAVLFIDLDHLKPVNDTLGHDVGDILLKAVADRLRSVIQREADTVARLGGDEFVVLLSRVNTVHEAELVATRLLAVLNRPFVIGPHTIQISASIGVAISPQHGSEVSILLRSADAAMYCAKKVGRNTYRIFEPSMIPAAEQPKLS